MKLKIKNPKHVKVFAVRAICILLVGTMLFSLLWSLTACSTGKASNGAEEDPYGVAERTASSIIDKLKTKYISAGLPYFNPSIDQGKEIFLGFISAVENDFEGEVKFDTSSVVPNSCGYTVNLESPKDAWGNSFKFIFGMPDTEEITYSIIAVSGGPDHVSTLNEVTELQAYADITSDDLICFTGNYTVKLSSGERTTVGSIYDASNVLVASSSDLQLYNESASDAAYSTVRNGAGVEDLIASSSDLQMYENSSTDSSIDSSSDSFSDSSTSFEDSSFSSLDSSDSSDFSESNEEGIEDATENIIASSSDLILFN